MLTSHVLSLVLLAAATAGCLALCVQWVCVLRHRFDDAPVPAPSPARLAGISILKPLCGVDDGLEANLECFASLGHPAYEVILGVKDTRDPAYAVALAAVARWPDVMRLELQEGEPGLNPKVNQLITLAAAARHELVLISDSNTRVGPGYLEEISRLFEDPTVGCVSHPVSGVGEQSLGSLMDNLYLCTTAAAGQIAAKRAAGQDLVVGKSMALRRETVDALQGFYSVRDVLAEDFVIGQWVTKRLGQRAVVARAPVYNVSQKKSVRTFFQRYVRWSIIHHTCVPTPLYLAQSILNPLPWAVLAACLSPSARMLGAVGAVAALKCVHDVLVFRMMRPGQRLPLGTLPAVFLKDALLFVAWVNGLVARSVNWRGHSLRVRAGSRLVRPAAAPARVPAEHAPELLAG